MKTNLEKYAAEMSHKIKLSGLDCYHWSEISLVIDELLKYADFSGTDNMGDVCFIGFTNGSQISYARKDNEGEGAFYCDSANECYIPIYMRKDHLHRIELTSNGLVTAESLGLHK